MSFKTCFCFFDVFVFHFLGFVPGGGGSLAVQRSSKRRGAFGEELEREASARVAKDACHLGCVITVRPFFCWVLIFLKGGLPGLTDLYGFLCLDACVINCKTFFFGWIICYFFITWGPASFGIGWFSLGLKCVCCWVIWGWERSFVGCMLDNYGLLLFFGGVGLVWHFDLFFLLIWKRIGPSSQKRTSAPGLRIQGKQGMCGRQSHLAQTSADVEVVNDVPMLII